MTVMRADSGESRRQSLGGRKRVGGGRGRCLLGRLLRREQGPAAGLVGVSIRRGVEVDTQLHG